MNSISANLNIMIKAAEKASIEEINLNYLYEDERDYYFINQKTFEQINIKKEIVGEKGKFLKEDLLIKISFYDDNLSLLNCQSKLIVK